MKNSGILLIIVFVSIVQLSYGQERYTIRGEFPDHSLDNEYILLYEQSALLGESERMKQAFIDSILVVNKEFHYEGTIHRKPFWHRSLAVKADIFDITQLSLWNQVIFNFALSTGKVRGKYQGLL